MNYIKHTIAAHEHLRARPDAGPLHIALYWALFFAWNAEYFPNGIDLNHDATMQAARIGNRKTYRATLYDLDQWGLLTYQPSRSKHRPSRCVLHDLSGAKVPPVHPTTVGSSAPDKTSLPGAEVPQPLRATMPPVAAPSGAKVPPDSLLDKTSFQTADANSGGAPEKKRGQGFANERLSGAESLDHSAPPTGAGPAHHAPKATARSKPGAPKKIGEKQATLRRAAAAPRERRRRPTRPEVPFEQSELATYEAFAAAFAGTDYALADLRFYHEKIRNWRQKGEVPLRRDWKATASQFFLNDAHDNRLKLAPGVQRHDPANPGPDNAGSGPTRSGYVSKWDK